MSSYPGHKEITSFIKEGEHAERVGMKVEARQKTVTADEFVVK